MIYITFYRSAPILRNTKFEFSLLGCWFTFCTHLKPRQIAVGLIYCDIFIQHKHNITNRIVASFTAFNSVYNYWFPHETDFLSFGTLVQ